MKKVMICAITLLPLIILLTLFVSTTVIGFSTYVYVQQIEFVNEKYELKKTDENNVSERLKINVFPMQANNKEVEYWSEDTSIATVDEDGNVTSVDFGEVIIYARSKENSTIKASCKVLVTDDKIHRLKAVAPPEKMLFSESIKLSFTFVPKEAQKADLVFESLNEYATVSPDGTVTANNEVGGMAKIRIYAKDNPSAQTEVEIKVYGKVESLSFNDEAAVLDAVTEFDLPEVIISPKKAAPDAKLYYYLSDKDKDIATIDQENGKLKFGKAGTVTLYVRDDYEHEIAKQYTSTNGHYETVKFDETSTEITVNYEDYTSENDYLLGVTYSGTPEKATEKITLITANPDVITAENGKFVVKGGGTTDIYVEITTYEGETVRATLKVTVNRKADSIDFLDETGNGKNKYAVTLESTFNIRTKILPEDSTDTVSSYEIVSGNATVSAAGIVTFNAVTEPQTAVVKVKASSGATSELTVTYIPQAANPVQITTGGSYSFVMPKSTAEEKFITFAPYYTLYSVDDIEYYVNGKKVDGLLANIGAPGEYKVEARDKSDTTIAESTVTVIRKAESVNAKLYATWGETKELLSGTLYTSAKTISIENIVIAPDDATKKTPDSIVLSNTTVATVSGSVLTFSKAGTVTLTIKVDEATFTATIESTCGLFDEKTVVNTADRTVDKGTSLNVGDFFTSVSPAKADLSNAYFEWDGKTKGQSIDLKNCPGGNYNVRVFYTNKQGTPIPSEYFKITVREKATEIKPKNGTFVIADSNEVNLKDLFNIIPSTANYLIDAKYSLEPSSCEASSRPSISDGKLTLPSEGGKAVVTVTLENGVNKKFAIVYYGETTKLYGGEFVEIGDKFTVNISEDVRNNINADSAITIINDCATLSNDFIITVNKVGAFQVTIGSTTYDFEGVVKANTVNLDIANSRDAEVSSSGGYLTALSQIKLSATLNEGATNKGIAYAITSGGTIATIGETTGVLEFSAAGTVIVTAKDFFGAESTLTITSTYGTYNKIQFNTEIGDEIAYEDYKNNELVLDYTGTPKTAKKYAEVEFESDNSKVIAVENGRLIVKGGGKATITVKTTDCDGNKVTAQKTIYVTRKADSIDFLDEKGNGGITQVVTLATTFNIRTKILPEDSTDAVASYEIVSGKATVSDDGIATFDAATEPQTAVVKVTAKGGATSELTVTYIPQAANPVQITNGGSYSFVMPKSTAEEKFITFAPYYTLYSVDDIEYYVNGKKVDGLSAKITAPDKYKVEARKATGDTIAESTVTVIRKAESVNAKLYATWGETKELLSGTLYTSAKTISIENIVIAPDDATKKTPDSIVSSNTTVATVSGSVLTFNKAGTVTLTITVDEAKFTAKITSTFGGFYDNTATKEHTLDVSDGEKTLTVTDVFKDCEPYKFDFENVKFSLKEEYGDRAVVGETAQSVTFKAGGTYSIKMEYPAANGETKTGTITVNVKETARGVTFEGGSFKLASSNVVELSGIYSACPATANVGNTATSYEFVGDVSKELATIDKTTGTLKFKNAGKVIVKVTLGSGKSGNIAVAYGGETPKFKGNIGDAENYTKDSSYYVTVGSSFVIDISGKNLNVDSEISVVCDESNDCATLSNDFVITVNKVGAFQVKIVNSATGEVYTYYFEGVVKATDVILGIKDNDEESKAYLLSNGTYLTGLKDEVITISATLNEGATNKGITYTITSGDEYATITKQPDGLCELKFKAAGTVTVTATEKFGISSSITIRSTYGKVESVSLNTDSITTLDYDGAQLANGYDFTNYFTPYPKQASITKGTVKLSVSDKDNESATVTIDELKVKLSARTNFTLTCEPESGASTENSASVYITVNRKATSISVNGTDISEIPDTYTITSHRAFIDVSCAIIPADANIDTDVTITMESGSEYATFNSSTNRLFFTSIGIVELKFTYAGEKLKVVKFKTEKISDTVKFNVDNDEPIVVSKDEYFSFSDIDVSKLSDLELSGDAVLERSDENFLVNKSGDFTLTGTLNGSTFTRTLRVTSEFKGIKGVKIEDAGITSSPTDISENGTYLTASKTVTVMFDGIGDAFNADGTTPTVTYSLISGGSATVDETTGVITFTTHGTVTFKITVDEATFTANVQSTCGLFDTTTEFYTVVTSEFYVGSKDKNTLSLSTLYKTVSPANADRANAWFVIEKNYGNKVTLANDKQSVTFNSGGDYELKIIYNTIDNEKEITLNVHANEEPERLDPTKGEFVIATSNEVTLSTLFTIDPSTANYNNKATYSLDSLSYASIDQNKGTLTFTSAGKAVVTVTLEKESVTKTFAIVYYGETTKLYGGECVEKGSSFAIDLTSVASSLNADSEISISNACAALSNDFIITVNEVGKFQVTIGDNTYSFEGVVKATGVNLGIKDNVEESKAHLLSKDTYLTGLMEIALRSSVVGDNVSYKGITYTTDTEIATVTEDGVLTFKQAGTVTVTATEKFGISASITIRSTCGKVESVSLKDNNNTTITLDYDDDQLANGYDFTDYFKPYPAQASIAANTVTLSVSDKNNESATVTIDGLKVKLTARTNFTLTCAPESGANTENSASVYITVNRKATSIKVNGTDISEITKITADRSFIDVKTALVPADANEFTTISFGITAGGDYATLSGNRITFKQANNDVTVTFTYANGATKAITFSTSRLTETVSIGSNTIVVPRGELFTFGDVDFDLITDLALSGGVAITKDGNNYKIGTSGSYTLSGKNNGAEFTKTLIVTARFVGFNGVKVTDSKNGAATDTAIEENDKYSTASKALTVSFDGVGDAVNRDGTKPTVIYGLNTTSVATIAQDGELTFNGSGTVTVTITVSGTNHGGTSYTEQFTFTVYSSFGHIDDFTLENENKTIDITIDDTSSYTLAYGGYEPLNGTISEKLSFKSNNENIATVDQNGLVKFFGTGTVKITVSAVKGNGTKLSRVISFEINKRVDKITVINSETDDRQRSQVIVNQDTYNLATALSSTASGTPTAPKSLKRSSANTSGERVLDLSKIAPTLTALTYSVKDGKEGCEVDQNGVVTFTASGKYVIVITAVGGATIEFPITKVDSDVTIIEVDTSKEISSINFIAEKQYVIDAGFGSTVPTVDIPFTDVIVSVNAELGVFKTEKGGTGSQITITAEITATITTFVEQAVTDITFRKAITNISNTANTTFDLTDYGAKVLPDTAGRVVDGAFKAYEVTYSSSDNDVASVENGVLTFHKAGEVTVTFTAGTITKSFTVNSTFGYATKLELAENVKNLFEFTSGSYTFAKGTDFTVTPANAWESKYNLTVTSSNKNVATVDGLTLNFAGGGETTLTFNYTVLSPNGNSATATLTLTVRVIKRASGVSVTYDGRTTQNVLTSGDFKLNASVLGENLSPSKLVYASSDESVATVDESGNVTFHKSGVACKITVTVVSDYDGSTEATTEVTVRKTPYTIKQIADTTSALEFNFENGTNYSLYYIGSALPSAFSATSDGVLTVTEQGDVAIAKGGTATLTITAGSATKTVEIAVYRRATDFETSSKLTNEEYVIAGTTLNLFDKAPLETITPADAAYDKTVEFDYDQSIATIDENGTVTFKTNATLTVDILVKRGNAVEVGKTVTVRSTLGKAITAQIKKDGAAAESSYTIDVGKSITFTVDGLLPSDLTLSAQTLTANPSVGGVVTAQVNAENKTITVNGVGKGSCTLTINVAGFNYTVSLTVIQKATEVRIKYNGNVVSTINTLNNTLTLTAEVLPVTANDAAVIWSASSGISVNDGVVTLPAAYGTYTITATAHDGSGCSATVTIEYKDLTGFDLAYDGKTIENNGTVYMAYNEGRVTVTIVPEPSTITGVSINDFAATASYGSAISFDQASFTMTITTPSMNDHFEDVIAVTYKGQYEYKLNVYRSGVQSITFKYVNKDLDNKLDTDYGYQQILLFGNRSYYGGVQSYYKMAVEVKPTNDYLQYVNFTANKGLTITKDANDNSFVYVNFNGFAGSSLAEILADNFTNGEAVVSATDIGKKLGEAAYSYTYHVVNAVNIFDAEGYISGGSDIVLHVNLGHDDEISSGMSNCVRFEGYENSLNKTTVYGNGYLINYAYENNRHTKKSWGKTVITSATSYGYTPVGIANSINIKLKGTNDIVSGDTNREYYFIELSSVQNVYYCEAYNMLRVIESYNSTPYIKRSLFRTCAESGAISSAKDDAANGTSAMTFEDVIMFDVGSRAIETHANPIRVKGFLDVYNFQNQDALNKELTGVSIGGGVFDKITSANANLIEEVNGEKWFNMVGLSAKGYMDMYYYTDGYTENSGYKLITTSDPAVNGLAKVEIKYTIYKFTIWSYPNTSEHIRWSDQFNADGSLNNSKMIGTTWKITRLQQQPTSSN